jgi:hypothetical protein
MTFALRIAMLLLVILALTGCPGPNYAPYNNMRNSYGEIRRGPMVPEEWVYRARPTGS